MSKSLIPKHLTRVSDLIERTKCNGDGITVAVLDTGVDPGAAGLSKTPSGKPKIVDIIDCSGSGDVDMTKVSQSKEDFTVEGMGGRVLRLGPEICAMNPSNEFHVGCKPAYDLMPRTLKARVHDERKSEWMKINKEKVQGVLDAISKLQENNQLQGDDKKSMQADLEAQKEMLISLEKNYEDKGPVYDCVTFFDGKNWRAIVGESSDLSGCVVLEDYRINCKYATIGDGVLLNFGVNIHEEGNILSIVSSVGTHGTHVAGIIGAYYPNAPEMNGMAPEAQIVSLRIGDGRLGSSETHKSMMRAIAYMLQHSKPISGEKEPSKDGITIDVANMSYGESTGLPNRGKFKEALELLVYKHNVLFVASGGNSGPALSTLGAPGGTTEAAIGVGAYVTPDMLSEAYFSLPSDLKNNEIYAKPAKSHNGNGEKKKESKKKPDKKVNNNMSCFLPNETYSLSKRTVSAIPYTWSSRGPVFDGGMGTCICAPGGAIAPVDRWSLQKQQRMNGTSMSSPSAAGAIAVILSFLKQRHILYSSIMLRRVLEFTANGLDISAFQSKDACTKDLVFSCGSGSIDALGACQYFEKHHMISAAVSSTLLTNPLFWVFQTRVSELEGGRRVRKNGTGIMNSVRGIYLRGHFETQCLQRYQVKVNPVSPDDEHKITKEARSNMEIKFTLRSTATWIEVPTSFMLNGDVDQFPIKVDPSGLESGKVHYAQIEGFVAEKESSTKAPLFKVPVTVIKPELLRDVNSCNTITNLKSSTGTVLRKFYEVPLGAKLVRIKVIAGENFLMNDEKRNDDSDKAAVISDSNPIPCASPTADTREFKIHLVQHCPNKSFKNTSYGAGLLLNSKNAPEIVHKVHDGKLLEVCIAQLWSSPGPCTIEKIEVKFTGLTVDPPMLTAAPMAKCFDKIEVSQKTSVPGVYGNQNGASSPLVPTACIREVERCVSPDSVSFSTLGKRDHLIGYGNISQMRIKYTMQIPENNSTISVRFPELNHSFHESEIMGGPYLFILDKNGQIMHVSDVKPKRIELPKGTYTIDAYIMHFDGLFLNELRELKAHIRYKLGSSLSMLPYKSRNGAMLEMKSDLVQTRGRNLQSGESLALIFSAPDVKKIPDWTKTGDVFRGTLSVDDESSVSYPIFYHVNKDKGSSKEEKVPANKNTTDSKSSDDQSFSSALEKKILEFKTTQLSDLLDNGKLKDFDSQYSLFVEEMGGDATLDLKLMALERFEKAVLEQPEPQTNKSELFKSAGKAIEACDKIIAPKEEGGESSEKKKDEKQDKTLKEYAVKCAVFRKLRILTKIWTLDENAEVSLSDGGEVKERKVIDLINEGTKEAETHIKVDANVKSITKPNKYHKTIGCTDLILLVVQMKMIDKKYGSALKLYEDYFGKSSNKQHITKDGHTLKIEIMQKLDWKHQGVYEENRSHIMFPEHWNKY